MITSKQFIHFCENHKIKHDENYINLSGRCFVKFKDVKDPDLDKSFFNPSDTFIYVSFTDKFYDETDYLYKPFEKLYNSTISDEDGWYSYESYGEIHIIEPIHCYTEEELKGLFSTKNISKNNVIETNIPFNTLDQLEHLYSQFNQFTKNLKDFYYSESFQNAVQTYKNNVKMAKELNIANKDIVKKTHQIIQRKHDLTEDFKE